MDSGTGGIAMRRSTDWGVGSPRFRIVARAYSAAMMTPPTTTPMIERQPTPAISPAVFQPLLAIVSRLYVDSLRHGSRREPRRGSKSTKICVFFVAFDLFVPSCLLNAGDTRWPEHGARHIHGVVARDGDASWQ